MAGSIQVPDIEHSTFIAAPPARVYETLTTAEGWDGWFTRGTRIDPQPGGRIHLRWENFAAGRWTLEDGGPVLGAEPNRMFSFQWYPVPSSTIVTFRLEPLGEGTLLKVTETGYRPEDLDALVNCSVGWGEALTLLKFYLEHGNVYGGVPPEPGNQSANSDENTVPPP